MALAALIVVLATGFPAHSEGITLSAATSTQAVAQKESVEERIRREFADTPVLIDIARCESTFRQFRKDGSVLHGGYKNHMIGIFQVLYTHDIEADSLGFNIYTIEGNIGYSKWLYKHLGTQPWVDSIGCWG